MTRLEDAVRSLGVAELAERLLGMVDDRGPVYVDTDGPEAVALWLGEPTDDNIEDIIGVGHNLRAAILDALDTIEEWS
jgi:hypothetical protein